MRVGAVFQKHGKYIGEIERYRKSIDKTVDPFSRIKDTEQAKLANREP